MKCEQIGIGDLFEQQFVHIKDFSCFNLGNVVPALSTLDIVNCHLNPVSQI